MSDPFDDIQCEEVFITGGGHMGAVKQALLRLEAEFGPEAAAQLLDDYCDGKELPIKVVNLIKGEDKDA